MSSGGEVVQAIVVGSIIIVIFIAAIAVGGALHDTAMYTLTETLNFKEPYLSMAASVTDTAGLYYPICILGIVLTIAWVGKVVIIDTGYTTENQYERY